MKKHMVMLIGVAILGMALAACAATQETTLTTATPLPAEQGLRQLAVRDLAERLNMAEADILVESVTEVELSSEDLGCAQVVESTPDRTQPAVVIGQEITLLAGGKRYVYHGYGARLAYCSEEGAAETVSGAPIGVELEAIMESLDAQGRETVSQARVELAGELGIPVDEVNVVQAEKTRWSDSSLGCPEEGKMYAQAITPGYQVILEVDGQQYDYRANDQGLLKRCEAEE
jgi:hypothetical protein